jgi:hypothetical protein
MEEEDEDQIESQAEEEVE